LIDSFDSLTADEIKLVAYCGHSGAIARVGDQGILHDDELDVWLCGLKRWGTETTLCAALAVVDEAF